MAKGAGMIPHSTPRPPQEKVAFNPSVPSFLLASAWPQLQNFCSWSHFGTMLEHLASPIWTMEIRAFQILYWIFNSNKCAQHFMTSRHSSTCLNLTYCPYNNINSRHFSWDKNKWRQDGVYIHWHFIWSLGPQMEINWEFKIVSCILNIYTYMA